MTIFARRPFKRIKSPDRYNASSIDAQFINVEQAIPPQRVRTVTSSETATVADQTIIVDATGGAVTITLPDPTRAAAFVVTIMKIDASGNAVTVGGTVSGVVSPTLPARYNSLTVQSTGTEYVKLASV